MSQEKLYTPNDLIQFENHNRYSSIGKMLDSMKQTAPSFGFGTSTRYQAQQIYKDKKLLQKGKHSPGPCYNSTLEIYNREPQITIGNAERQSQNQTQYDYYQRKDQEFSPHKANDFRRAQNPKVRFGLAQRFKTDYGHVIPGPGQYDHQSNIKKQPSYSIAAKRPISKSFQGSTPDLIGPGSYTLPIENSIKIGFTQDSKLKTNKSIDRNQTYYIGSSIGTQIKSKKPTKPSYSMSRQNRDIKSGIFKKDMMGTQTRVCISMPKY